ncbi:hypothetical protein ACFLZ2_03120 [Candidatus Margulisiibacteriota bacterium]
MNKAQCFESYPIWIVFLANVLALSIYVVGSYIMIQLGIAWLILYLILIAFIEIRLPLKSCVNCYYYGKRCFSGRGLLCALFLKKGDPQKFLETKISWKDLWPEFLLPLAPIFAGIGILIMNFNWFLLGSVLLLFVLAFVGNPIIRGSFACKYCKQRELGCSAEQYFSKKS